MRKTLKKFMAFGLVVSMVGARQQQDHQQKRGQRQRLQEKQEQRQRPRAATF